MSKPIERLDDAHEKVVRDTVEKVLKFLNDTLPRSKTCSHLNLSLNVVVGTLVAIAHSFVPEDREKDFIDNVVVGTLVAIAHIFVPEDREKDFIDNIAITLQANFDINRHNRNLS